MKLFIRKRLLTAISLACCISLSAHAVKVTFNVRNVTVMQAMNQLKKDTGYSFVFCANSIDLDRTVSVNSKNTELSDVVEQILKGQNVSYQIDGKQIIVSPLQKTVEKKTQTTSAQQQRAKTIKGNILDEKGEPIIGASIKIKGGTTGTISDLNGNFVLDVPENSTLDISYIGFVPQEIKIGRRNTLNITLQEDNKVLNEVVVIGYGTQRKGDVTSSVGSVKSEDFIVGAVNDAGSLIQGKIAGLSITNPNGNPVGGTEVSLRGNTTILGASTNPLILIDGIPGGFNTVAPEDIESIDVLKDGSAAAIYGSRGTNGVVLITTKKAKGDNINGVQYSGYLTLTSIVKRPDFCTAADYRQQITDGLRDASWDLGYDTNWFDEILRTGFSHVHNASFKGGNLATNYIFNLNYRELQGIFHKSDKQEFQGRAEINHNMFDDKLHFNFQLLANKRGYTSTRDGGSFDTYSWRQAMIHNPTEPIKNEDGTWHENTGIFNYDNPLARIYESDGQQDVQQTRISSNISFNPIKELSLNALLSYDRISQSGGYYETKQHISNVRDGRNGYATTGSSHNTTKLLELTAQFRKTIDAHTIQALVGYSYQGNNYNNQYERNYNFPTDQFSWHNIGVGQALKEGKGTQYSYWLDTNLIGFFGRLNYNYKDRYLLMASLRHEAASQLVGTEHPWGNFPSVSLGWRITEEDFMKKQTLFNDMKLRAGYGVTGSQPNESFLGKSLLGYGSYYLYDGLWIRALQPTQNANSKLKWEEKHEYDIGLDFSMLNYRLNINIDWYYRLIKGLLYDYTVPSPPNLYTTTRANVGEMSNNGIEIMINAIPVQTKDLTWNSTVTFSTNSNKLKRLSNDLYQASSDYFMTGWIEEPVKTESHIVRIGHRVGDIYGFQVVDVDDDGKWIYNDKDGNLVGYDDFTHTFEDKKVIGNGVPKWYLGFHNQLKYKNWDLAVNMRGAFGFQVINGLRMFYENRSRQDWNRLTSAFDKVFGKAVLNPLCSEEFNSYYVEDGDYWKIDNITIGYNFRNLGKYIKMLRLYGTVNNAITITGYKGIDPEVSTAGLNPGYDNRDTYPHTRAFTFGVNVTF
jgi:TonB-linked SusC/RagA family outer membrane protein